MLSFRIWVARLANQSAKSMANEPQKNQTLALPSARNGFVVPKVFGILGRGILPAATDTGLVIGIPIPPFLGKGSAPIPERAVGSEIIGGTSPVSPSFPSGQGLAPVGTGGIWLGIGPPLGSHHGGAEPAASPYGSTQLEGELYTYWYKFIESQYPIGSRCKNLPSDGAYDRAIACNSYIKKSEKGETTPKLLEFFT